MKVTPFRWSGLWNWGRILGIAGIFVIGTPALMAQEKESSGVWSFDPSAEQRDALSRISAESLRGHLAFLASDLLEGRNTPSMGLDVAAEYVAAQFMRAGLKPAGDEGYYQAASSTALTPDRDGFRCSLKLGGQSIELSAESFSMTGIREIHIDGASVVKLPFGSAADLRKYDLEGRVVLTEFPPVPEQQAELMDYLNRRREFLSEAERLLPVLIVTVDRRSREESNFFATSVLERPGTGRRGQGDAAPVVTISGESVVRAFDSMAHGPADAAFSFSLNLDAPIRREVRLRNVVGLLEGSDPALKNSYILLTAHYDGTGPRAATGDDNIWNAANDNASGTVTLLEIASTLSRLHPRPRRSLVFMAFYGEEKGLLGSRYYAEHPLFPIERTIACVNLEQLGRIDSTEGNQKNRASLTGFDYSDMGEIFRIAGEHVGVTVYRDSLRSDPYFDRSDNRALAALGIPAHTLCVAYGYPDYHGAGDHCDKIDYENLEKTNRLIAAALLMLAQSEAVPRWNPDNPGAAEYRRAWEKHHNK